MLTDGFIWLTIGVGNGIVAEKIEGREENNVRIRPKSKLYSMTATAVMTAVLSVISPIALFLGPVPVSLCTLGIFLSAYVLGCRRCVLAVLTYVLLGAAGMPVFGGFTGGAGRLFGPTGGYILGYLLLAWVTGWAVERSAQRWAQMAGMVLGTVLLYLLGTAWYCVQAGQGLRAAVMMCVLPFLPGDAVKILCACVAGPSLQRKLEQAGLK